MLFLVGEKQNIENIYTLSKPYIQSAKISTEELKCGYQKWLRAVQPGVPHVNGSEPAYVLEPGRVFQLFNVFQAQSALDDTHYDIQLPNASGSDRSQGVLDWTRRTVEELGALHPPFGWLFKLAMDMVFHVESADSTGGSTSNAVGVLWVNPSTTWSDRDMQEFLVHELDHTLLFLHEWRYGLFKDYDRMADPANYAKSAIRANMRPLDKAYHSAIVAADVLLMRDRVTGHGGDYVLHPSTDRLIPKVFDCVESIRTLDHREDLLTDVARELLEQCLAQVSALDRRLGTCTG